jgi:hypothetical protein
LSLHNAVGGFVVDGSAVADGAVVGGSAGGGADGALVPRFGCVARADGCEVDGRGTAVAPATVFADVVCFVVLTAAELEVGRLSVLAVFPLPPHEATATVTAVTNMRRAAFRS